MPNQIVSIEPHQSARPMKVVKDQDGELWLCDKGVDPNKDLREQECWNCREMPFTRDD